MPGFVVIIAELMRAGTTLYSALIINEQNSMYIETFIVNIYIGAIIT